MLRPVRQRAFHVRRPVVESLTGKAVHQIQSDVLKTGPACVRKGCMCLLGRMHSPEQHQILFLKGLDADVETVDAGRPEAL